MSKVFISYNRDDSDFVDRLMADLAEGGHETWVDRDDINAGAGWRTSISRAIRSCRAFVLVLSDKSVSSTNVIKELSIADTHRRYIVPLLIDDAEIPPDMEYQLADLQLIKFGGLDYDQGVQRLLAALDRADLADIPAPPPPEFEARQFGEPAKETVTIHTPVRRNPARRVDPETFVISGGGATGPKRSPASGETNRMAIVSIVSALLGFSFLPGMAFPIALITGYKARKQIHGADGKEKGLGLAKAGILLGWIGIIISVLVLCYWSVLLSEEMMY